MIPLLGRLRAMEAGAPVRRHLVNALMSGGDHVLLVGLWIFSTPFFVNRLGTERFGVWALSNAMVASSIVFGLGIREATVDAVARTRAGGQLRELGPLMATAFGLYAGLGLAAGGGLAGAAGVLARDVFGIGPALQPEAVQAFRLTGLLVAVFFLDQIIEAGIHGFERYHLTARVNMAGRSIVMLANLLWVLGGHGLAAVLLTTGCGFGAQALVKLWLLRRRFIPDLVLAGGVRTDLGRLLARRGLHFWAQVLTGTLSLQADRFVVAALMDASAVALYSVCLQVGQQVHLLLARALAFFFPVASGLTRTRALLPLRRYYRYAFEFTLVAVAALALPLIALAPDILEVWIGAEFAARAGATMQLVALAFAAAAFGVVPYYLLNGSGYASWNTACSTLGALIVVVATAVLVPRMGLEGAGWARLASAPVVLVLFHAVHTRVLRDGSQLSLALAGAGLLVVAGGGWLGAHAWEERSGDLWVLGARGLALLGAGATLALGAVYVARRAFAPPSEGAFGR